MIELRDVSYRVGSAEILEGVSARFRPNRFNVILGPNGAGKSTLLKIATGLLRPTSGTVRYDDRDVSAIPADALARTRSVLSQHIELAFALPVEEVVMMGRYPHYGRAPSARDREIVREAIEMVGMSDKRLQSYPTLSGGEQQKAQLARVLAQIWIDDRDASAAPPSYLFLDEPTSSLDIYYQLHLLDLVRDLRSHHTTLIAILHDLNLALQYGEAFFLLERGRLILEADSAAEIPLSLVERVFRVRAESLTAPSGGPEVWRFTL